MPKKKIHPDSRSGRSMASAARSARFLKLQAGRAATARRLSGQKATTRAELNARKAPAKPLTQSEKAAELRKSLQPEGLRRLDEALKQKRKKN